MAVSFSRQGAYIVYMSNWQLLSKKEVYNHPHRRVEEWKVKVPSGKERNFAIFVGDDVVIVFGITTDKQILVIYQYYIAHQTKVPSLVAGIVDGGDHAKTAIQELHEEAGCVAKEWVYLGSSFKGKYATGVYHYYLAMDVKRVGAQQLEASEDIDVKFVSQKEFFALLRTSKLQDVAQVACAYRALDYLGKLS